MVALITFANIINSNVLPTRVKELSLEEYAIKLYRTYMGIDFIDSGYYEVNHARNLDDAKLMYKSEKKNFYLEQLQEDLESCIDAYSNELLDNPNLDFELTKSFSDYLHEIFNEHRVSKYVNFGNYSQYYGFVIYDNGTEFHLVNLDTDEDKVISLLS